MTDRQAFIDTIRDRPDDDTVRLVYADYLDEFGNEEDATLARHIREACEEKGLPEVPPLIEAELFLVKPHVLGINGFEAVISPTQGEKLWESHGLCDISTPNFRANDLLVFHKQDEVSSSEKAIISGVMTKPKVVVADAERDRIRQIRRSVTETRTALLNAFCDKYKLDPLRQEFDKGFVRTLAISLTDLVDNGDAIFAEQPVERVVVTWWDYSRIRSRFAGDGGVDGAIESRFDNRADWAVVSLGREPTGPVSAESLCRSTWPKIKEWEFGHGPFSVPGRNARLSVNGHDISDQVVSMSMAMAGNPEVTLPTGVIEVPDDPSHAAPLERRSNSRKNSIPPDPRTRRNPRFPRPR